MTVEDARKAIDAASAIRHRTRRADGAHPRDEYVDHLLLAVCDIIDHLESVENEGVCDAVVPIEFTGYDAYDGPQVRRVVRVLASRWPVSGDGELAGRLSDEDQVWLAELRVPR